MKRILILTFVFIITLISVYSVMDYQYNELQKKLIIANTYINTQTTQINQLKVINSQYKNANTDLKNQLEISILKNEAYESTEVVFPMTITEDEIDMISKTVLGEAGGCNTYEQSMVVWCILNRLDTGRWGNRAAGVVAAPYQFHGYVKSYPVKADIRNLVIDVITRWQLEKLYGWDVGRTLPQDMINFHANKEGTHNLFYNDKREYYDWSSKFNPYED